MSDFVAIAVFTEAFEFSALSGHAYETDSDFSEPISAGHEFAFVDGADIRVDANLGFEGACLAAFPKAKS